MNWNGLTLPDGAYFSDDAVIIYHADARDILPVLPKVDLVLTDPPYGVDVAYGAYQDTPDELAKLIDSALPTLRQHAPIVLATTGVKNLWLWPKPDWVMCWFMPNGVGVGPWGFCTWQPIVAYGKDPYAGRGSQPDGIERLVAVADRNAHPCSKPVSVMRWLVQRGTTEPSAIILDPFMGSGTTLRAAKDLGRKAIGIEIEEKYCEIAARRMAQTVMSLEAGL